ncbi:hypothetical protein C5167_042759 [Papaver somniferum]|uniref:RWD domain-containing protein n=1 Tax=Papaver somniferum TaxID=3469 RepID=A0A4Y7L6B5_PAPSO|nr:hypothetical protein C5167_042759 [Papaver somniferum]
MMDLLRTQVIHGGVVKSSVDSTQQKCPIKLNLGVGAYRTEAWDAQQVKEVSFDPYSTTCPSIGTVLYGLCTWLWLLEEDVAVEIDASDSGLNTSNRCFQITISPQEEDDEETSKVLLALVFAHTEKYPDEPPLLHVKRHPKILAWP